MHSRNMAASGSKRRFEFWNTFGLSDVLEDLDREYSLINRPEDPDECEDLVEEPPEQDFISESEEFEAADSTTESEISVTQKSSISSISNNNNTAICTTDTVVSNTVSTSSTSPVSTVNSFYVSLTLSSIVCYSLPAFLSLQLIFVVSL
jgi:hypothetical protein